MDYAAALPASTKNTKKIQVQLETPEIPDYVEPLDWWSESALRVLNERYLATYPNGIRETPEAMLYRVARAAAEAEVTWLDTTVDAKQVVDFWTKSFYLLMAKNYFLPNSPSLMNAGAGNGLQLSACFTAKIEDSIEGIYDTLKNAALIAKSGGGIGHCFSNLRPANSKVKTTQGISSGPISFLSLYDSSTAAIKQGGCVIPTTKVSTTKGILAIGTLGPENQDPKSWHDCTDKFSVITDTNIEEVEEFYYNGLSDVRTITTKHGYNITGTPQHRLRIIDSEGNYVWKSFSELNLGDWVALQKNTYPNVESNTEFKEPDNIPHANAMKIKYPKNPTKELGEFLGYFVGDGCISYGNKKASNNFIGAGRLILTICDAEEEIKETILSHAENIFGIKPCVNKKPNDGSTNFYFNSTQLVRFMEINNLSKKNAGSACVPNQAFTLGKVFARSFLRGLFSADGTVNTEGHVSLATISYQLASGVQQLLLSLGIPSSISKVVPPPINRYGRANIIYNVRVITEDGRQEYKKSIGFLTTKKTERMNIPRIYEQGDVIPNQKIVLNKLYCERNNYNRTEVHKDFTHHIHGFRSIKSKLTKRNLKILCNKYDFVAKSSLSWFLTNNQFYDQVKNIEDSKEITVDLSVSNSHTYIANGFVSHNTRRGANMATFHDWHPDLWNPDNPWSSFIGCKAFKEDGTRGITNFNVSVLASDDFMKAVKDDGNWDLIDKWNNNKVTCTYKARELFDKMAEYSHKSGDPGLLFVDKANNSGSNPIPDLETLDTTNPCGEIWLNSYDACNLGSLNLGQFITTNSNGSKVINYESLSMSAKLSTRMLDDIIEINPFPLQQITDKVRSLRRIGLGVMGWADLLFHLKIAYNSKEAQNLAISLMKFINDAALEETYEMAKRRGSFPLFNQSIYKNGKRRRNAQMTGIAPTGTISIIDNCSSGIEPVFALAYQHRVKLPEGERVLNIVNDTFKKLLTEEGCYYKSVESYVAIHGVITGYNKYAENNAYRMIPDWIEETFVCAQEISPKDHILMQAAFQVNTENSISKTINLPNSATVQDIKDAYMLAYDTGCKGITVFRDGCLSTGQVLNIGTKDKEESVIQDKVDSIAEVLAEENKVIQQNIPEFDRTEVKEFTRPITLHGYTRQISSPEGTVHITLNSDDSGDLREIFVSVGRSGSDVSALSEALGRLVSLTLQMNSQVTNRQKLDLIHNQLRGIGGSSSVGFGPNRVSSLADAVGKVLEEHIYGTATGKWEPYDAMTLGGSGQIMKKDSPTDYDTIASGGSGQIAKKNKLVGNACPSCNNIGTYVLEEGCKKCHGCGYSQC